MPIALVAAGVSAAAGIGGAVISSHAAGKAADAASQASQANTALQSQIYDSNKAMEQPYVTRGNAAGDTYNALLGLGGGTGATTGTAGAPDWNAYLTANPDVAAGYNATADKNQFPTVQDYAAWHYQHYGQNEGRQLTSIGGTPGTPGLSAADAAKNAFSTFTGSDGYKWRLDQGLNAVNTGYALHGGLDSGAANKALVDYGQNEASNEFGKYMGYLGNQQQTGLTAANALAGVGTAYGNQVASNNNNAAGAAGSAAVATGNAWSGALGQVANGVGQLAQSSYGGGSLSPVNYGAMKTPDNILGSI